MISKRLARPRPQFAAPAKKMRVFCTPPGEGKMTTCYSDRAAALHREPHTHLPSDPALRVKTLESLAVERGLVPPESIDAWIEPIQSTSVRSAEPRWWRSGQS